MADPTDCPSKTFIFIPCTRALSKGCKATPLNPNPLTHTRPLNHDLYEKPTRQVRRALARQSPTVPTQCLYPHAKTNVALN